MRLFLLNKAISSNPSLFSLFCFAFYFSRPFLKDGLTVDDISSLTTFIPFVRYRNLHRYIYAILTIHCIRHFPRRYVPFVEVEVLDGH